MKTRCWVLGGTGLIGRAIQRLAATAPELEFHFLGRREFDLKRTPTFAAARGGDLVVDLVPGLFPRDSEEMSAASYHDQFTSPHVELVRDLKYRGLKKFIYVSSGGTVYGHNPAKRPFKEDDPLAPVSRYGESKVLLERAAAAPNTIILRPSNVFSTDPGSGRPRGVVGTFMELVRQGKPLSIFGSLDIIKDYVSDRDLARMIILCLQAERSGIYNVGAGVPISLGQIVSAFEAAAQRPLPLEFRPSYGNDVTWFCLDSSKAMNELGFVPQDQVLEWITAQRL